MPSFLLMRILTDCVQMTTPTYNPINIHTYLLPAVQLLNLLLPLHSSLAVALYEYDCFTLLGACLERMPSTHIPTELITAIIHLVRCE